MFSVKRLWQHQGPIVGRSMHSDGGRAAIFAPLDTGRRAAAVVRRLADGIALGLLVPDEQLPSESELSTRFEASRVTVRRALEVVRDEGLIAARQGFGWFVATEPVRQRLEHLGTIEDQLKAGGHQAERPQVADEADDDAGDVDEQ